MRISVVINTYNRGESLRRTLQSLRHQTHDPFEVVVVNGPSTDQTAQVLEEHRGAIRVGSCPQAHLSRSRNVGIALAAGEVVAFLDRSEEHTSELQSLRHLVCRLLLEKK